MVMVLNSCYVECSVLVVEITAANVANVCTFAVMGDADIDQTVIHVSSLYCKRLKVISKTYLLCSVVVVVIAQQLFSYRQLSRLSRCSASTGSTRIIDSVNL